MPERTLPMLVAYLWDLRAQCESQVRSLTDAQRQIDVVRDGLDQKATAQALVQLQQDLQRVAQANGEIRAALQEALRQTERLTAVNRDPPR